MQLTFQIGQTTDAWNFMFKTDWKEDRKPKQANLQKQSSNCYWFSFWLSLACKTAPNIQKITFHCIALSSFSSYSSILYRLKFLFQLQFVIFFFFLFFNFGTRFNHSSTHKNIYNIDTMGGCTFIKTLINLNTATLLCTAPQFLLSLQSQQCSEDNVDVLVLP